MTQRMLPPGPARTALFTLWLALLALAGPRVLRRWWRDPSSVPDMPHPWTRARAAERVRRGRRRQAVIAFAALSFGSLGLAADAYAPRFAPLGSVEDVAMALALTCVVLTFSVRLFNRPRFLVPPSLRDQPGSVREWALERRRRAGGDGGP